MLRCWMVVHASTYWKLIMSKLLVFCCHAVDSNAPFLPCLLSFQLCPTHPFLPFDLLAPGILGTLEFRAFPEKYRKGHWWWQPTCVSSYHAFLNLLLSPTYNIWCVWLAACEIYMTTRIFCQNRWSDTAAITFSPVNPGFPVSPGGPSEPWRWKKKCRISLLHSSVPAY